MGADIAAYGGPDWTTSNPGGNDGRFGASVQRAAKKGSPVVPGSHLKVLAEGDSVLYTIVVLRGQYEAGKFEGETFVPGNLLNTAIMNMYYLLLHFFVFLKCSII